LNFAVNLADVRFAHGTSSLLSYTEKLQFEIL
jgi:hypothetical protein